MNGARVESINLSDGGVPKFSVPECLVQPSGLEGDRQRDLEHHGGPVRAVCLYSSELITAMKQEGHPIGVGLLGENLTLSGLDWSAIAPGTRLRVGAVELEVTQYTHPCRNIGYAFLKGDFSRVSQKVHPGWSRLYARVTTPGPVKVGDVVQVLT
jgi:MOSC domain-containing protein YiiM